MMRKAFLCSVLALFAACAAAEAQRPIAASAERVSANTPKNLDEAFAALDSLLPDSTRRQIQNFPEDSLWRFHMGLGLWMRNTWGLWSGSALQRDLVARGLRHPDDMSALILTAYRRRLRGEPLGIEVEVNRYAEYWRVMAEPKSLRVAGCAGEVKLQGGVGALPATGKSYRFIHLAKCPADQSWWAYEVDRGWYRPDTLTVQRFTSPHQ